MKDTIGKALQTIREQRNVSQQALAEGIGVTQTYLSLLENGKRMPSIGLIEKYEYYFKIPLGVIMWLGVSDRQVPLDKKDTFRAMKLVIDTMIQSIFTK